MEPAVERDDIADFEQAFWLLCRRGIKSLFDVGRQPTAIGLAQVRNPLVALGAALCIEFCCRRREPRHLFRGNP
jgi:hypothetical protein